MEFTKPFIQQESETFSLATFGITEYHNNIDDENEKQRNENEKQRKEHLRILLEQLSFIKEELEFETNKKLSDITTLNTLTSEEYTELIKIYLISELFSKIPNWKYNIGPECTYYNPGMSTYSKKYIHCYKRHLHIPQLSIKKIEQRGVKLLRLVRMGYRNFGKDADGNDICDKYNIRYKKALRMEWGHFKDLMRRIGDIY